MSGSSPVLVALGDSAILVRFSATLSDEANRQAVKFASHLRVARSAGIVEIVANLVSVLVRFDARAVSFADVAGELRLRLSSPEARDEVAPGSIRLIETQYGGAGGPDLEAAAQLAGMNAADFIAAHAGADLRVLATGFAPGFVYCGFHRDSMRLPRRTEIRTSVPAGTILFAAGQTAITATPIPTGWHVIGRTSFRNFNAEQTPPTLLVAGERVRFVDNLS